MQGTLCKSPVQRAGFRDFFGISLDALNQCTDYPVQSCGLEADLGQQVATDQKGKLNRNAPSSNERTRNAVVPKRIGGALTAEESPDPEDRNERNASSQPSRAIYLHRLRTQKTWWNARCSLCCCCTRFSLGSYLRYTSAVSTGQVSVHRPQR
jgi:hypothetical protein